MEKEIKQRWDSKRNSIYNLKSNIDRIKRRVRQDLVSCNEKDRLTALVIRIMLLTSERVGNETSATNGHFGVSQFQNKHIKVMGNRVTLDYMGKSGVEHEKTFVDETSAVMLKELLSRKKPYLFTTKDGFRIKPDRVNRYLSNFDATSKDIRGFNANRLMVMELNRIGKTEEKDRAKVFNASLRKIGAKVGHGAPTLRKHYLLPEIETTFYRYGDVRRIIIS
jgi:DNA topoisomerase-1